MIEYLGFITLGIVIGFVLALFSILFLYKKFPLLINQHVWFEVAPEYEQEIVTIFKHARSIEMFVIPPTIYKDDKEMKFTPIAVRCVFTLGRWFDFNLNSARGYLYSYVLKTLQKNDICELDSGVY